MIPQELLNELGVVDWGYTEDFTPGSFSRFENWVEAGKNGPLDYLADHRRNMRNDLRKVFPEFQSALVFLVSYRPTKKWLLENNRHEIASYALGFGGEDYHTVLRPAIRRVLAHLQESRPELKGIVSLDILPVLERDLAHRAGLGWFGKNSMLIHKSEGSYFLIGSLLLSEKLALPIKSVVPDFCGTCRACVDACPTLAIDGESRTLTAEKCISTFTVEVMRDMPPPAGYENSRGEYFGCDICQDVCPWNKKPLERTTGKLDLGKSPSVAEFFKMTPSELVPFLEGQSGRAVERYLEGSALARPGKKGWLKNLKNRPR